MAPNPNNKTIDEILKELDILFKSHYLGYKKYQEPYKQIICQLKLYKNTHEKKDLLIVLQQKIDSKETFLSLESNIWGILFTISGIFIAMISDIILSNYDILNHFNNIPAHFYVIFVIFVAMSLVILYCLSIKTIREKSKKKCFYKFVYNFLNSYK